MSSTISTTKAATDWVTPLPGTSSDAASQRVRTLCSAILREHERSGSDANFLLFSQLVVAELEAKLV